MMTLRRQPLEVVENKGRPRAPNRNVCTTDPGIRLATGCIKRSLKERFANSLTTESYGGLMICGIYWGGNIGVNSRVEGVDYGWTPLFSDPRNSCEYQKRLLSWFRAWGHPLSSVHPTELDRGIVQTNLFIGTAKEFEADVNRPESWQSALKALTECVNELDVSGVMFTSTLLPRSIVRNLSRLPAPGEGLLVDPRLKWTPVQSGSLELMFARAGDVRLLSCAHPRHEIRSPDISQSAPAMTEWLGAVLQRYREKQEWLSRRLAAGGARNAHVETAAAC